MNKTCSISGVIALMVSHCAGMLDLVALPVWVGTLIEYYQFDPQQAGSLATLFLFGAVVASIVLAHRLHSCNGRWVAVIGFALAAALFGLITQVTDYATMALLHAAAGVSVGAALSVTHGTIAHSQNPHRLFAIVGTALGLFAVAFYAITPKLIATNGGLTLFMIFSVVMLIATLVSVFAFPLADSRLDEDNPNPPKISSTPAASARIPAVVWFGIVGIIAMGVVQSMTFSFLERVGDSQGYELQAITAVLVAASIVNLFPAPLAGILERRISARCVMLSGAGIQAMLSFLIMSTSSYVLYAICASVFAAVIIFTHTFVFGVLAHLDVSGRAMAATPAMIMVGSGIGPILGGSLVKGFVYESIGIAALCIAVVDIFCFSRIHYDNQSAQLQGRKV